MPFGSKKRKKSPEILLVPLIDILLVVLIFILTQTTFRQFPVVEINLPRAGQNNSMEKPEVVIVSVTTSPPAIFLNNRPIEVESLELEFLTIAERNPETRIALNADKNAPFGIVMRIWQAVQSAGLSKIQTLAQEAVINPE